MVAKSLNFTVSENLVSEAPRFFPGMDALVKEMLQNAYRAGAKSLTFTLNPKAREFSVQDDGCGIEDPQALLTIGQSGWEDSEQYDPAGIGALSMLRSEVEQVTIRSQDWRMVWTQANIARKNRQPVTVEDAPPIRGTVFALRIKEDAAATVLENLHEWVESARGYYPMSVSWKGPCQCKSHSGKIEECTGHCKTFAPPKPLKYSFEINGVKIEYSPVEYGRSFRATWEYSPMHHIAHTVSDRGLEEAIDVYLGNKYPALAPRQHERGFLAGKTVAHFSPGNNFNVVPVLPHRNQLDRNEGLRTFAAELVEYFLSAIIKDIAQLLSSVDETDQIESLVKAGASEFVSDMAKSWRVDHWAWLARQAGLYPILAYDYSDVWMSRPFEDGDWDFTLNAAPTTWNRCLTEGSVVKDSELARSINAGAELGLDQPRAFYDCSPGDEDEVIIMEASYSPGKVAARAQRIIVNGVDVKFLATPGDYTDLPSEIVFVVSASDKELAQMIKRGENARYLGNMAALHGIETFVKERFGRLYEGDEHGYYVLNEGGAASLARAELAYLLDSKKGERLSAAAIVDENILAELNTASEAMRGVTSRIHLSDTPDVADLIAQAMDLLDDMDALKNELEKISTELKS